MFAQVMITALLVIPLQLFRYLHMTQDSKDWDQFCHNVKQYGMNDFDNGSFSYGAVWDANCVLPSQMDSTLYTLLR